MALISLSGRISSGKDTVGSIAQFLLHTEGLWDQKTFDIYQTRPSKGVASNWQNYWEIKKFAGKLKQVATLLTGVPLEKWEDQEFKESEMPRQWDYLKQMFENDENGEDGYATMPMTYRLFLQRLGTEAMREGLHTNVWVNALFAGYKGTPATILHDDCPVNRTGSKKYDFEITEEDELTHSHIGMLYPKWIITDCRFPNEFAAVKERGGLCIKVERYPDVKVARSSTDITVEKFDVSNPKHKALFEAESSMLHPSEIALDSHTFDYVLANHGTIEELVVEVQKMLSHFKLLPDGDRN